ncbi:hypothetical protein ACFY5J_00490 [Peribacillus butanolivorans]|uniref:hypothetical protein n=2 Tax=Peribacillus butanolivorans TaxID=421767 RepID=UPI0036C3F0FA
MKNFTTFNYTKEVLWEMEREFHSAYIQKPNIPINKKGKEKRTTFKVEYIDYTKLDIFVVDEDSKWLMGRPWLTSNKKTK